MTPNHRDAQQPTDPNGTHVSWIVACLLAETVEERNGDSYQVEDLVREIAIQPEAVVGSLKDPLFSSRLRNALGVVAPRTLSTRSSKDTATKRVGANEASAQRTRTNRIKAGQDPTSLDALLARVSRFEELRLAATMMGESPEKSALNRVVEMLQTAERERAGGILYGCNVSVVNELVENKYRYLHGTGTRREVSASTMIGLQELLVEPDGNKRGTFLYNFDRIDEAALGQRVLRLGETLEAIDRGTRDASSHPSAVPRLQRLLLRDLSYSPKRCLDALPYVANKRNGQILHAVRGALVTEIASTSEARRRELGAVLYKEPSHGYSR